MTKSRPAARKTEIRRRRTGCLTCRDRHVRCSEEKPECKNCARKSRICTWPKDGDVFLQQHPAIRQQNSRRRRTNELGEPPDSKTLIPLNASPLRQSLNTTSSPSEPRIQLPTPALSAASSVTIREEDGRQDTWHLTADEATRGQPASSLRPSISSCDLSSEELACWRSEVLQAYNEDPDLSQTHSASSICRSQSARLKESIDLEHSSPIPPNLEPNAELFSDWSAVGASETVVSALNDGKEARLLQVYLRECAPWFDASDGHRHYGRKCVDRMMACPPWRAAALALSAKHIELHQQLDTVTEPLSLHLYQLAVQLAIDSISGRFDCVGTTAGCVILAVYEMMTVKYHDWRRHLRGCTSIYSHNRWNGDSLGLIGATFWNYARIGVLTLTY